MNKFDDLFKKIDRKGLEDSVDSIKSLLNSPDGKKIRDKIKNIDKKTLLQKLNKVNESDVPNSKKIKQLSKDPNLINRLNKFLNDNKF